MVLIHPIAGANIILVTGVPTISFLVQSRMEIDPTVAWLEAGMYTAVEVSDAAMVRTHANAQRYQYCFCGLNVGLMGHKDLVVTLGPDTCNLVVVMIDIRAIEVLKNDYSAL